MKAFEIDSGVEWTSRDADGTFSYEGVILSHEFGRVSFLTEVGIITVPETQGTFKQIDAPAIKREVPKHIKEEITAKKKAATEDGLPKAGTKVEQIVSLLKGKTFLTRKDAIATIVAAGISTTAGASTMYNSAKKFL